MVSSYSLGGASGPVHSPVPPVVEVPVDVVLADVVLADVAPAPAVVDPPVVDPAVVDPAVVDPAVAEVDAVDPPVVGPPVVDPAVVDPAVVDPAVVDALAVPASSVLPAPVAVLVALPGQSSLHIGSDASVGSPPLQAVPAATSVTITMGQKHTVRTRCSSPKRLERMQQRAVSTPLDFSCNAALGSNDCTVTWLPPSRGLEQCGEGSLRDARL